MRKPRQLQFFQQGLRFFGGRLLQGRRKSRRPLSTRDPIHLVMRSSWAMGPFSLLQPRNRKAVERLIVDLAKKYGIRVYRRAIASNHIHLIVKIPHRRPYTAFVRVLSGKIATHVMRQQSFLNFMDLPGHLKRDGEPIARSEPQGKEQQFWQFRPFTRVLHWGRDFTTCCRYVCQNQLEALGFIAYARRSRGDLYTKWIHETVLRPLANSG